MDSSTCTTPSKPTFSIAWAINLPVSTSLLDEIVAICSNCPSDEISSDRFLVRFFITLLTVLSISLLILTAFSPLSKEDNPAWIISLANKVEVVVPSPALSAVFIAACLSNNWPKCSSGSVFKNAWATVTPSLVETGGSICPLYITTFLPFGPNVDTTAFANLLIPLNKPWLACLQNFIWFSTILNIC